METAPTFERRQNRFPVPTERQNVGNNERIISAIAGLLIGYTAIKNFRRGGAPLVAPAAYLLWRGVSGYCHLNAITGRNTKALAKPFEFSKTVVILRDKSEVYNYWRQLENLPMIMKHIQRVDRINENQYHWEAIFNQQKFSWNARITEDIPNERISWQSLESADVQNSGTVEFTDAPELGTELKVSFEYTPAQSEFGKIIASFLNPVFKQMVKEDLKNFKRNMESSEVPAGKLGN